MHIIIRIVVIYQLAVLELAIDGGMDLLGTNGVNKGDLCCRPLDAVLLPCLKVSFL